MMCARVRVGRLLNCVLHFIQRVTKLACVLTVPTCLLCLICTRRWPLCHLRTKLYVSALSRLYAERDRFFVSWRVTDGCLCMCVCGEISLCLCLRVYIRVVLQSTL